MSKVSGRDILAGFQLTFFENKLTFMKKAGLRTTTLVHCKARQVLCDLFGTNQGNGPKMTFVAGINKVHMKNLNS